MSTPAHRTAPGYSYFITTKCWGGRSVFQVTDIAEILLTTLLHYRNSGAYLLHEFVNMRDHLHLMVTPSSQTSLEKTVQLIKGGSSHQIHKMRGGKMEIWQVGFHDWTIRDLEDWKAKANYIHMNPVKARLCERPEDWPYSSAGCKFPLDGIPAKYHNVASGAKAQVISPPAPGLKPRPPQEAEKTGGVRGRFGGQADVGPKGPSPKAELAPGLKAWPPQEAEKTGVVRGRFGGQADVGPKGPTPKSVSAKEETA